MDSDQSLTWFLILVLGSILVGLFASLLGVGGGFVFTPFLIDVQLLPLSSSLALSSVFGLVVALISSMTRFLRPTTRKQISFSIGIKVGLVCALFAGAGAYFSRFVSVDLIRCLFIGMIGFMTYRTVKRMRTGSNHGWVIAEQPQKIGFWQFLPLPIFGIVAGMLAIGGGIFFVPYFHNIFRFSIHRSAATSGFAVFITSVGSACGHFPSLLLVEPVVIMTAIGCGIAGGIMGAFVLPKVSSRLLMIASLFLQVLVMGLHLIKLV